MEEERLTHQEHVTRLFNQLRRIDPGTDFGHEYAYYEVRGTMDVVNHVGNDQDPTAKFEVIFTAAGMLEETWTGYFKVDIHPDYVFEVVYSRKDESSTLSYFKVVPRRGVRNNSLRRKTTRFTDEISQIRSGY
jgi:hypothetical protein